MGVTPKTTCIIAATPRSGSWLLCETLATTGLVGEPQEYFNTRLIPGWREHFGMRPGAGFLRYIQRVVGYGTGDNGIFATKLHWTQLTAFADKVRNAPGEWPADDGELLERFFPDIRYVFIRRDDTARQAISYWRATQTHLWWDVEGLDGTGTDIGGTEVAGTDPGDADPGDAVAPETPAAPAGDLEPDFRQIRWMEDMLIAQDRQWADHISGHGVPWVEVRYEEFVADRLATLVAVHDLLGVPVPDDVALPEPKLQKQSDDQTEEWLIAYGAIRDTLPSIPPSAYWSPTANQLVAGDGAAAEPKAVGRRPRATRPPRRPTPPAADDPGGAGPSVDDELPWSFRYVIDDRGVDTGFGVLRSPVGDDEFDFLERFQAERCTLGWASYGTYPKIHRFFDGRDMAESGLHGRERDYLAGLKGWAHCFRRADAYLPKRVPRALLSESDFTDVRAVRSTGLAGHRPAKRWDVIYVCCPNNFNEQTKNWRLAKRCLTRLSEELGTTALLVGRRDAPDVPDVAGIETTDELPWDELMACLAQSRTLLVPNRLDASPVLLTEALCLDVPVAVNRRILGGWKYVVPETGRFFTDESDVSAAVASCLGGEFATSAWFRTFYGPDNAGARLAEFLRTVLRSEQSGFQRSLPTWRRAYLASQIP